MVRQGSVLRLLLGSLKRESLLKKSALRIVLALAVVLLRPLAFVAGRHQALKRCGGTGRGRVARAAESGAAVVTAEDE